jgi:hypothetical protein
MSHFGRKYYVQVAILTLPSKWQNISGISMDLIKQWGWKNCKEVMNSSDLIKSLTIWRCGVMFNNAARIIQKNWREYYLLNKVKPYMHRFKLDNCPLTRKKLLSDMDKVRLEISASRQFKPALHAKLNRLIRMYLAEDYDRFMTKRKKLWSEVKMVLNQELITRSNGENWVPVTPINLTEKQKKWCHSAHCYSGFYYSSVDLAESNAEIARLKALDKKRNDAARVIQHAWTQHWKKFQPEEYESDYSTESNIEAAKEAARLYDLEPYEYEFREMREEELEELERLQEKMDGWVDEMCNPYNN